MNLNQMTDTQLINQINELGEQILATHREEQPFFERLCDEYDAIASELNDRGLWE